jgi:membrane-associated HD superfamily phosphohydrolase
MFSKINFTIIIKDHWQTLRNYGDSKSSIGDFFLFVLFPLIFSGALVYFKVTLNKDLVNTLVTALSVFAALLFNLLMLIYDIIKKGNDGDPEKQLKSIFLRQTYSNISYAILISFFTIIVLLTFFIFQENKIATSIISFISITLLSNFLLTGLMVLKRVHFTLRKEAGS